MASKDAVDRVIAVDAMGGDNAPRVNIDGCLAALADAPTIGIRLIGPEALLRSELTKRGVQPNTRLQIVNADAVITMDDHATSGILRKKGSSIHVGLQMVKQGQASAFVSAGHSGAVMAGALLTLGRLENVERPAIVIRLPTAEGFVTVLDVGANVDCRASHLLQFAEMGNIYARTIENLPNPRIALLSNGSEPQKGNELTRGAHALLSKAAGLHYIGYVEGHDLFRGTADVVVCDGFVGNVVLKMAEGLAETTFRWFRSEIRRDPLSIVGVLLLKRVLSAFRKKFDYQPYGAAPLLGIDGMVLISHGSSTEVAIRNGILTAVRGIEENFVSKIRQHLEDRRKGDPNNREQEPK